MQIDSVLTALGLILAVAAFFIPLRRQIRNEKIAAQKTAKEEQERAVNEAVKKACDPLVAQLTERTTDRDYWRARADDLQDQVNKKA